MAQETNDNVCLQHALVSVHQTSRSKGFQNRFLCELGFGCKVGSVKSATDNKNVFPPRVGFRDLASKRAGTQRMYSTAL